MGETVETVLGWWNRIQVYSSFHTDVKEGVVETVMGKEGTVTRRLNFVLE
jgi:hypothetical protein